MPFCGIRSKDGPHTETKLMAVDKRRITVLYLEKQAHFGQFYISRFYNTLFFVDKRKYPVVETTTNYLHTSKHPGDKLRTTSYIGKVCQATHLETQPFFHLQLLRQAWSFQHAALNDWVQGASPDVISSNMCCVDLIRTLQLAFCRHMDSLMS